MATNEYIPVFLGFFVHLVNSCVGISQYLQSGMVLPLAISTYIIQQRISHPQSKIFRCEDNGVWCCLLMMAISYIVEHDGNAILRIVTPLTLFCYGFSRCSWNELRVGHYVAMIVLTIYGAVTSRIFFRDPLSILLIILCSVTYIQLLYKLPEVFKKCFTYGEMSVLLQLYICEVYIVLLYGTGALKLSTIEKLSVIVFIGAHIAIASFYVLSRCQCPPFFLWFTIFIIAAVYVIFSLWFNLSIDELLIFVQQVILNHTSILLLVWWILWLASSVLLVCFYGSSTPQKTSKDSFYFSYENSTNYTSASCDNTDSIMEDSTTYNQISSPNLSRDYDLHQNKCESVQCSSDNRSHMFMLLRKYFHVAILCVYIPGLMLAPPLLYIASILAAAVLIIVEAVRWMEIKPIGSVLNEYLCVFLDEQDQGALILTPIYLIVGCSLPIWWNVKLINFQCTLTMYSGLVSVGVGDAAASYIGRKYGKHKWPGSKKSIEGTMAAFMAQLCALLLLQFCGISGAIITMETILCVLLVSLLEAFTLQIDNLVIPIFTWMLLTSLQPTF